MNSKLYLCVLLYAYRLTVCTPDLSRSLPTSSERCRSLPISIGICRSMPNSANLCRSQPISADICRSLSISPNLSGSPRSLISSSLDLSRYLSRSLRSELFRSLPTFFRSVPICPDLSRSLTPFSCSLSSCLYGIM